MQSFEYARPQTLDQAVRLLAAEPEHSTVLAGGSDLLALMKDRIETPRRLVSLQGIAELRGVHETPEGGLRLGALVTLDELSGHAAVRRLHPVLAEAAGHAAGPQIRNVATLAGNLCQRPRCWYFRTGHGLLPERDGKSMVVEGDNRFHAILGNAGPAYFVHPSTLAPLLIALGSQLTLHGRGGQRKVRLEDFYRTPSRPGEREHDLGPAEVLAELLVPPLAGRKVWSYEVRQRQTLDWSLATAAVALEIEERDPRAIRKARVVLGQVAPTPWNAAPAERLLAGARLDAALAARAGDAAVEGARALSRNHYKIQLARVAVRRALLAATGQEA